MISALRGRGTRDYVSGKDDRPQFGVVVPFSKFQDSRSACPFLLSQRGVGRATDMSWHWLRQNLVGVKRWHETCNMHESSGAVDLYSVQLTTSQHLARGPRVGGNGSWGITTSFHRTMQGYANMVEEV
jgi:hypothetical protein